MSNKQESAPTSGSRVLGKAFIQALLVSPVTITAAHGQETQTTDGTVSYDFVGHLDYRNINAPKVSATLDALPITSERSLSENRYSSGAGVRRMWVGTGENAGDLSSTRVEAVAESGGDRTYPGLRLSQSVVFNNRIAVRGEVSYMDSKDNLLAGENGASASLAAAVRATEGLAVGARTRVDTIGDDQSRVTEFGVRKDFHLGAFNVRLSVIRGQRGEGGPYYTQRDLKNLGETYTDMELAMRLDGKTPGNIDSSLIENEDWRGPIAFVQVRKAEGKVSAQPPFGPLGARTDLDAVRAGLRFNF